MRAAFSMVPNNLFIGCGLICVTCGCGGGETPPPTTAIPAAASDQQQSAVPATAEAAQESPTTPLEFASAMEWAVYSGDVQAFDASIAWDRLLDQATQGLPGAESARDSFVTEFRQSLSHGSALARQVVGVVSQGGSYDLLRVQEVDGRSRPIFRLVAHDGSLNYHEMLLHRNSDGSLVVEDIYIFLSGETLSNTLRRVFVPTAYESAPAITSHLTPVELEFVQHWEVITKFTEFLGPGQFAQALEVYQGMPASLQQDRTIMLMYIQAAMRLDEDVYAAAMEEFRRIYPHDPCVDILSIDSYAAADRYDSAMGCIDRLDQAVAGDPYLNVLRANLLISQGDFETAQQLAQAALDEEPDMIDAYWAFVSISLAQQDFIGTTQLLNAIAENFEVTFDDISMIPDYAEYVQSQPYQEFLQSRATARDQAADSSDIR